MTLPVTARVQRLNLHDETKALLQTLTIKPVARFATLYQRERTEGGASSRYCFTLKYSQLFVAEGGGRPVVNIVSLVLRSLWMMSILKGDTAKKSNATANRSAFLSGFWIQAALATPRFPNEISAGDCCVACVSRLPPAKVSLI